MSERKSTNGPIKVKTTWLLPKTLVKQLKQYALDNDTTLTAVVMEACADFLAKKRKGRTERTILNGWINSVMSLHLGGAMSVKENVPQIAKFLFNIYAADALEFEATASVRIIEFLPQIFPNANSMERSRMMQILKVQTLTKFCHIAENLGATALAFKSSYEDAKTEILGLFNTISNYQVTQIKKFYS